VAIFTVMKQIGNMGALLAVWNGAGSMRADKQLTLDQHYLDWRSYMRLDGSEVLYGEDWDARKADLLRRSEGRCEYGEGFQRCTSEGAIPSHIEPRHPHRDDRMSNLKHYCMYHDRLTEKQGWRKIRSDKRERRANAQQS
jgi:hypothetical protein